MLELKEAKGEVVELPRRDQEKTSPKRARRAPRPTRGPESPIGAWQTTALFLSVRVVRPRHRPRAPCLPALDGAREPAA